MWRKFKEWFSVQLVKYPGRMVLGVILFFNIAFLILAAAVISALSALKEPCEVTLTSDSKYVTDAINKGWIISWKKNGWKKADNKAVSNQDLWEELYALTRTHEVTFHKVAGHADNEYNNRCDALARGAITELRKSLPPEELAKLEASNEEEVES